MMRSGVAEFNFSVGQEVITSFNKPEIHVLDGNLVDHDQLLTFQKYEIFQSKYDSEILKIHLQCAKLQFDMKVCYQVYPDIAGCVKWLEFSNYGRKDLRLNRMFFEVLNTCPGEFADSDFFKKQGIDRVTPFHNASGDDDIIQLHNDKLNEGMLLGNTAPGPLRYFMLYPCWGAGISIGYNMSGADFNKYISPGESFSTDKALSYVYAGDKDCPKTLNGFREMVRRQLPLCPDNGSVMYCTWLPFLKNINEELLLDLAERAAALGFGWFVVDDGWFTDNNWEVDADKFPNGLEPISEKVRSLGMKFGLWLNIGNDYGKIGSRPEDNALDFNGEPKPFGFGRKLTSRCMASNHRDVMSAKLLELAEKYDVDYYKLDFSNTCSPYGMMAYGCHSTEHAHHRNYSDSILEQYGSMMQLRNEVKDKFPDLVIDFSFETFGTEFPSIGALQFSELHHSSNMNTLKPEILRADRIRRTIYEYSRVLPDERILGSLICLQNENDLEHLLTPCAGTPLVAGDLRKITPENADVIGKLSACLNEIIEYGPMVDKVLLKGNGFDGYARFNKLGNGLVAVFGKTDGFTLNIPGLPEGKYELVNIISEESLAACSADELSNGIELKSSINGVLPLALKKL
ncbi:MAG: hypothetical protein GY750_08570 [Lentisphaerae bacterium]|nr:hypothetical protein [Lentisphaerota bacterium]MCP4101463.1 hypothetical protein [Lentisphaerota bacterium]